MTAEQLRALQAPLKERYRSDPGSAGVRLTARGGLELERLGCRVETNAGTVEAGLHPSAGGDGSQVCAGEMLLEALVACAGVTLAAVATAMGIEIRSGSVRAEGELDVRGTLGVDRGVPVGFRTIRLTLELDTDAEGDRLAKLGELTERYCVVAQTLTRPGELRVEVRTRAEG